MGSIARRDNGKWRARYRDGSGREHAKHFQRRRDAELWLRDQLTRLDQGSWASPQRGRVLFAAFSEEWLARQVALKPSTRARYESILRVHVVPRWGRMPLARIGYDGVARWVADLAAAGLSPSSTRQVYRVFALVCAEAVKGGRLARSPADGVALPRVVQQDRRFLSADEVARLADAAGEPGRLVVLTLAYTGLRFGELAALRGLDGSTCSGAA